MKDYTINYQNNTVMVSKKFANMANDISSSAYKTLNQFRKDGFSIEYKTTKVKANKEKHKGLTIDFMERFITNHQDKDILLKEFNRTKLLYKGQSSYYAKMKQWFLGQFPELKSTGKKAKYAILTMDFMDNYIENHDYRDEIQPNYNRVKDLYRGHKDIYAKTKEWFIQQFPKLTVEDIVLEMETEIATTKLFEKSSEDIKDQLKTA